jgi:hypothetical protein
MSTVIMARIVPAHCPHHKIKMEIVGHLYWVTASRRSGPKSNCEFIVYGVPHIGLFGHLR